MSMPLLVTLFTSQYLSSNKLRFVSSSICHLPYCCDYDTFEGVQQGSQIGRQSDASLYLKRAHGNLLSIHFVFAISVFISFINMLYILGWLLSAQTWNNDIEMKNIDKKFFTTFAQHNRWIGDSKDVNFEPCLRAEL